MRLLLASVAFLFVTAGAMAQDITPEGNWRDEFGTSFKISLCGDGTQLCAILTDVQGESRTEANLAYVDQQVLQANMTSPNQWKGTVVFDGAEAKSTVTQTSADSIEIEGCRGILCSTLVFNRI
jgi:uncharacterized protein (DUF2147 family)